MKKILLACLSLSLSLLSQNAEAAFTGNTWDPFGTAQTPAPGSPTTGGFTGNLTGNWEDLSWSTSTTEAAQATPQKFVENTAACFAVNANGNTPAFTITMNNNHTVAGIFNGPLNPDPCTVTVQGPGIMTIGGTGGALFANLQGLAVTSDTGDPGNLIINVAVAGALASSGAFTLEDNGNVYLNGVNTYNSGTCVGFSTSFTGICFITNANPAQPGICTSFGSNTIGISNCPGGAFVAQGTSAFAVTNAITVLNHGVQAVNLSSGPAPSLTFSGPFSLGTNTLIIGAGQTPSLTIISGVISGSGGITRGQGAGNTGTLELNAANTFTGSLTCSNGVLALGSAGSINTAANIFIAGGGTFDVSAVASPYNLSASTTLNASGNTAAATLVGPSGGVVNLGAQPINLTFDGTDSALTVSQGALTFNGNQISVNATSLLTAGTYTLMTVTGGIINGAPSTNAAVTGAGLANGSLATIQVSGGNINLVVTSPGNSDIWNGLDFSVSPKWSDGNNWASTTAPSLFGDMVTFSGSTGLTPVMDSSYTVYSIFFDGSASPFNLTASGANLLTISDGVSNYSSSLQTFSQPVQMVDFGQPGATTWDVTGNSIAITGILSDTGKGLSVTTASGPNALILSNANTYTGGTTINNGAVVMANTIADAPCSIGPSGPVVIGSGSALTYTGSSAPISTSRTVSFSGGNAVLNLPNNPTLTLSGSVKSVSAGIGELASGTLILSGTADNSSLGMVVDSGATLVLNKTPSTSTVHALGGTTTTINTGGTLKIGGTGGFQLFSSCILFENFGGVIDLGGQNNSFSTMTLAGTGISGAALINSSATPSFITNAGSGIVLANDTTIGAPTGSPGNIFLASKITGSAALTYAGSGLLTLAGASTFSSGLNINPGCSVMITSGGFLTGGGGVGPVSIGANGALVLTNNAALANISVTGDATTKMNILMAGGNLWLTNSLTNFVGTFNISNLLNLNSAQLVIGSGALVSPNINSAATMNIYPGVAVDFNGFQTNTLPINLFGLPYATASFGALRLDFSVQSGPVVLHGTSSIGGGGASTSNSTISGVISETGGSFGLTMQGICRMSLTATNTYSGPTAVTGGTLLLSGNGSISNSSKLSVGPAATFDVSTLNSTTFSLSSSTSLSASGKGTTTNVGAFINGAAGGIVNLGARPISLTYTPTTVIGDLTNQSLVVSQGTLNLSGNAITVSNATTNLLGAGVYTLIQAPAITGSPASSVTLLGTGLVPGGSAVISVSGNTVIMTVTVSIVYTRPTVTSVKVSGTTLTLTATGGNAGGNYVLLESTNVATPVTNWIPVLTNAFDGSGNISLSTNVVNPAIPQEFYIIQNP